MPRRKVLAAFAATLTLALVGSAVAFAATITMSGSTSIAPLATKLAKAFVKTKAGDGTKFVILQGGSDVGITDASRGRVTLGMSSRDPKPADPGGIVFNKFARDGVCVVTNQDNQLNGLSQGQIQQIFSGQITRWSQLPNEVGADQSGSIHLITREVASGTQDAFQNIFMGEDLRVSGAADPEPSSGLQAQALKADPEAIGYVSFNFTDGLATVPYNGVECNLRNAKSGDYDGVRNFFFVSRGPVKGDAKKFLKFTRSDKKAQKIIGSNWVPLK
jgi:phosphate transport system substrate-binding protein